MKLPKEIYLRVGIKRL